MKELLGKVLIVVAMAMTSMVEARVLASSGFSEFKPTRQSHCIHMVSEKYLDGREIHIDLITEVSQSEIEEELWMCLEVVAGKIGDTSQIRDTQEVKGYSKKLTIYHRELNNETEDE